MLKDNGGQVIGSILNVNAGGFTVLTPNGYTLDIAYDGTFSPAQIYYTGASCSGTAYLNGGGTTPVDYRLTKTAVYSGTLGQLMVIDPAVANANAALAEVQALVRQNQAGVGTVVTEAGALTADSRDLIGAMAAPMASAATNLDRASENIEAATEKLQSDPTSIVRRRGYRDPPPPGAAP